MNIRKFLAIIILFILCLNTAFASVWEKSRVSDKIQEENKDLFDKVDRKKLPQASSGAEGNLLSLKQTDGTILTYLSGDKPFLNKRIKESIENRTLMQKLLGQEDGKRLIIGNKITYNIQNNKFRTARNLINAHADKFAQKEKKELVRLQKQYITTDNIDYKNFEDYYYTDLEDTYKDKLKDYQQKYKNKYNDKELNHASHTEIMYIDDVNKGYVETADTIASLKPMCANCEKAMLDLYKKKDKELAFISVEPPRADQAVDIKYKTGKTFITKYTLDDLPNTLHIKTQFVEDNWPNIGEDFIQPDPKNMYKVGKKPVKKNRYKARDQRIITGTAINKKISDSEEDTSFYKPKRKRSQKTIIQPVPECKRIKANPSSTT